MSAHSRANPALARKAVLRARIGLALFLASTIACVAVASSTAPEPQGQAGRNDFLLYRRVVERVRLGESYYDAAHRELIARGFPSRSVLNWRTPCYAWFLGRGPGPPWGHGILLAGLTVAVLSSGLAFHDDYGIVPATLGAVSLFGATAWCSNSDSVYLMEFWAGMLIVLSLCAYRRGLIGIGVGLGLLAVFYRELSLPYAVVCAGIAVRTGRKREACAWAVGLLVFAAFMACHAYQVRLRITAEDLAMNAGWVRFGGLGFVLKTARSNVFLTPLPLWCTAIYLPVATLGLAGGRGESGWRVGLTAVFFLGAFAVVGNPFNFYWGFLNAPLLAIGIAGAPRVLRGLLSTGFSPLSGLREHRRASSVSAVEGEGRPGYSVPRRP